MDGVGSRRFAMIPQDSLRNPGLQQHVLLPVLKASFRSPLHLHLYLERKGIRICLREHENIIWEGHGREEKLMYEPDKTERYDRTCHSRTRLDESTFENRVDMSSVDSGFCGMMKKRYALVQLPYWTQSDGRNNL